MQTLQKSVKQTNMQNVAAHIKQAAARSSGISNNNNYGNGAAAGATICEGAIRVAGEATKTETKPSGSTTPV